MQALLTSMLLVFWGCSDKEEDGTATPDAGGKTAGATMLVSTPKPTAAATEAPQETGTEVQYVDLITDNEKSVFLGLFYRGRPVRKTRFCRIIALTAIRIHGGAAFFMTRRKGGSASNLDIPLLLTAFT